MSKIISKKRTQTLQSIKPRGTQVMATGHAGGKQTGSKGNLVKHSDPIGTATVTCGALNVRNGAGTNYQRIGGLTYGKTVYVYEAQDGWLKIGYGTDYGWICAKYTNYTGSNPVTTEPEPTPQPEPEPTPEPTPEPEPTPQPEPEPTPEPEPEPEPATTFQVRVTPSDGLNVRTGPGTGYSRIGGLSQGTVVTVVGEQDGWYQIEYNGGTGWVCAQYTVKVGGTSEQPPSTDTTGKGQAAANLAAQYEGSRTKDLLGTLPYLSDLSGVSGSNNGYDLNCANFTCAILQQVGLLNSHSNLVSGVRTNCLNEGYHKSSKAEAKPGDIWLNGNQHAELVYSNSGGAVTLIGSNNKGGGDVQYVTKDSWSPNNYSNADYYSCQ